MPWLPDLHTPEEDLAYFQAQVRAAQGWVGVEDEHVVGYALARPGWLDHLYIDPENQGAGLGTALLGAAVQAVGPPVSLWAFQRNTLARAFYAARGFAEVEFTDGSGNEEKEPDVLLQRQ